MWEKHFAKSFVIIRKWNEARARAMYNVQRCGVMRIMFLT